MRELAISMADVVAGGRRGISLGSASGDWTPSPSPGIDPSGGGGGTRVMADVDGDGSYTDPGRLGPDNVLYLDNGDFSRSWEWSNGSGFHYTFDNGSVFFNNTDGSINGQFGDDLLAGQGEFVAPALDIFSTLFTDWINRKAEQSYEDRQRLNQRFSPAEIDTSYNENRWFNGRIFLENATAFRMNDGTIFYDRNSDGSMDVQLMRDGAGYLFATVDGATWEQVRK